MLAALMLASWVAQATDPRALPEPPGPPLPRAPTDPPPPDAPNALGVNGRFAYRRTGEGALGPAAGLSVGATYEHRYAAVWPGLQLGVALDLYYDRFATSVLGATADGTGGETTFEGQRLLTQTSFAAMQTLAFAISRVRLWTALGAGVTIGYLSSPERDLRPGSTTALQPLARAGAGIDVMLRGRAALALRADYTRPLTHPSFTTDAGQTFRPFGEMFDVGGGFLYRF